MEIDWKVKPDLKDFGTDDFWYDLSDGGYIRPEEILEDKKQIEALKEAIAIVRSFQNVIDSLAEER
jgi:hypothetical protein